MYKFGTYDLNWYKYRILLKKNRNTIFLNMHRKNLPIIITILAFISLRFSIRCLVEQKSLVNERNIYMLIVLNISLFICI